MFLKVSRCLPDRCKNTIKRMDVPAREAGISASTKEKQSLIMDTFGLFKIIKMITKGQKYHRKRNLKQW